MVNRKIEATRTRLHKAHEDLLKEVRIVTADTVKERYLGSGVTHNTLAGLLDYHDQKMKKVLKCGTII
ncbi:hypothetical protein Q4603_21705 [Zobellia galactanivorans]|uniref:hypothetical protein n=1 Tax=Zobellia galactanivorans (strain DSM 12802 / CCUG 47099 / CIP 106680 / NCIMB 13871 / Dsij) TaxID=63186 RepID=UPI0026E45DDD|nr:hypothetical protein [Zobellia galactanivorans]MDO6811247.1 hypothetical protein [Zobellia galactanivorans]